MNTNNPLILVALCAFVASLIAGCSKPPADLTPLMQATIAGDANKVSELLGTSSNVNATDKLGNTALTFAAGVHIIEPERSEKPGEKRSPPQTDTKIVEMLLKGGANPNVENKNGATPLTVAVFHGRAATVTTLLEKGADVNRVNSFGKTPLMYAAMYCYGDIAAILLKHGADPMTKGKFDGKSALDIATADSCNAITKQVQTQKGTGTK